MKKGLTASREKAAELIASGDVLVNNSVANKASRQIRSSDEIRIIIGTRYVSRGGMKLEGALKSFGIDPFDMRVLDVGSSTGGFSDCLLQRGVKELYAVDVGTNQLHEKIRNNPRVAVFEQTNIRDFVDPKGIGFELVVGDLSFVSVASLIPALLSLSKDKGQLVILVKPQFEVGHRDASKAKGVIKDPELWRYSLLKVAQAFQDHGAVILGLAASQIKGAEGNVEFFYHLRNGSTGENTDIELLVSQEIAKIV